jgi:hypothetical protein
LNGSLLTIDNQIIDSHNPSCLSNSSSNRTKLQYVGVGVLSKSAVLILAGSFLQSNQTYQFMVYMENRHNSSIQATGYVLVQVEDTSSPIIFIG